MTPTRDYNGPYEGPFLNRVAFPLGGIGAGMVCLEGTGAISHVSVRNSPQVFNEPHTYAALSFSTPLVKGPANAAKVLEGPVPSWKVFGSPGTGNGAAGTSFGLPRFRKASFVARFPFGHITLADDTIPLEVSLRGWSPFIPGSADDSSLPVGALEYRFRNPTDRAIEAVFSFSSKNFMAIGDAGNAILPIEGGFVLWQEGVAAAPFQQGAFAAFVDEDAVIVDHCWFKGGWWDSATLAWKAIAEGRPVANPPQQGSSPGASLFVPFSLPPQGTKTVRLMLAWHVPQSNLTAGHDPEGVPRCTQAHVPWYAGRFDTIQDVARYWRTHYERLRAETESFTQTFYDTTLPGEVIEAVAANLTILKSPTMLRQTDGRLWCWEGCSDSQGCCHGSCTHVWNYAQAVPHLFPELERTLRETEFQVSQNEQGHQTFRSGLPIRPVAHTFHAASDGQLGGLMKLYREWRIGGNTDWLRSLWPQAKASLDYAIATWDPRGKGVLEEPHHNTYDIEFWGPDGMCTSFYLGALTAAIEMGGAVGADVSRYRVLLEKGKKVLETELYNGEYFYQKTRWEGLDARFEGVDVAASGSGYAAAAAALNREGPKYQYGTGCLSDVVLGFWLARACGLGEIADRDKVRSSLKAIHRYNLMHDLTDFANPQRPAYALGTEGGLLLCTWPRGGALTLPFVYSNEVWTGIEYQVASHLMMEGLVEEGLEIVRLCRSRYDGRIRNPFNEYECGHWYARAMSSYGLLQGLTGVRYDAVQKTLYIDSRVGADFRSFLATGSGFGTAGLTQGKPFVEMRRGSLDVQRVVVSGREMPL
ncbi:MAG: GH116 family glycosyl hydrolase [Planctomycetota bacterium]